MSRYGNGETPYGLVVGTGDDAGVINWLGENYYTAPALNDKLLDFALGLVSEVDGLDSQLDQEFGHGQWTPPSIKLLRRLSELTGISHEALRGRMEALEART